MADPSSSSPKQLKRERDSPEQLGTETPAPAHRPRKVPTKELDSATTIHLAQMALVLLATDICLEKVLSEMGKDEPDVDLVAKLKTATESDWDKNKEFLINTLLLKGCSSSAKPIKTWKDDRGLSKDFINDSPLDRINFTLTDAALTRTISRFYQGDDYTHALHVSAERPNENVKKDIVQVTEQGFQLAKYMRTLQLHCLARVTALEACNSKLALSKNDTDNLRFRLMYNAVVPNLSSLPGQLNELEKIIETHGDLSAKERDFMVLYHLEDGQEEKRALGLLELAIKRIQKLPVLDLSDVVSL